MTSAPEVFHHVSQSQLSIARLYGGCYFNGHHYTYDAATDTLTRSDVAKRNKKEQAAKERAKWQAQCEEYDKKQGGLF